MLAVDTNVVVRYLLNDDAGQSARARRLVDDTETFLATTVLLETEWVLRSVFKLPQPAIAAAARQFIGLPTVRLEHPERVSVALDWFEQGMDFADALHLATTQDCNGFATFDRDFIKTATRLGLGRVAEP